MAIDYVKRAPGGRRPAEPPPGSVIRFSVGPYVYAAYRVSDAGDQCWWTTALEDVDEDNDWGGVSTTDTWAAIVKASGGAVEVAESWRKL